MAIRFATNGSNTINGTPQADQIFALTGNDTVNSRAGDDVIFGAAGNDTLLGSEGNDRLFGDTGNDILNGGTGRDIILSGTGNDRVNGGAGNDTILGGADRDTLTGAQGNDILVGGSGSDTLTGGAGKDDFALTRPNEGIDTIKDFVVADDRILVSATGFGGGLTPRAAIKPGQFTYGKAAGDANDRFIYDKGTGALYFDVDGTGTAKQVQIAGLTTKPLITNADIFVTPNIVSQSSIVQSTQINTQNSTNQVDFSGITTGNFPF